MKGVIEYLRPGVFSIIKNRPGIGAGFHSSQAEAKPNSFFQIQDELIKQVKSGVA